MKLSIVIPCYNESKNVPLILSRFDEVIMQDDIEVILVNNGSTDDSKQIIQEHMIKYKFARTVDIEINKGYGFGIVTGLKEAQGQFIGYTHADMQTDPKDVIRALEIIQMQKNPQACYIKGDRKGRPLFDQFFTIGMSFFETIYLGEKLWDINAQPNVFHRGFLASLQNTPDDFSLDLFFLYKAKKMNLEVIRFPVLFPERIHGESSWNTGLSAKWKFIKRTISFSRKLKEELL